MGAKYYLEKYLGLFSALMPHLLLCYSIMLLMFYLINIFSPVMGFLDSHVSRLFELVYAAVAFICGCIAVAQHRMSYFSIAMIVLAISFVVAPVMGLLSNSVQPMANDFFPTMAYATSITSMIFAVGDIIQRRKRERMVYESSPIDIRSAEEIDNS